MAGKDNLVPFKKKDPITGEIDPKINAKGRPAVQDIRKFLKEKLNEEVLLKDSTTKITILEGLTAKLVEMAKGGNMKAMEMLVSYGYGKPTQAIELSGKDGAQLITHDFSKLDNDALEKRIQHLELVARGGEEGNGHVASSPEGGEATP